MSDDEIERPDTERTEAERPDTERTEADRADIERADIERTDTKRTDAERHHPQRTPRPRGLSKATALMGARVAAGIIGLGVAAAAIAGGALLPLPSIEGEAPSITVKPVATAQELVCAGGILRLGDEAGQNVANATSIGRPLVASGSTGNAVDSGALDVAGTTKDAAPATISAPPDGPDVPLVAASQAEVAASPDFRGLATASCSPESSEAWLVGGATTVGRMTLLALANPGDVAATVDLRIWGEGGAVEAAGLTDITVQPRSQRVVPLSGLAPDLESPVVRVSSEGGRVVATLQQSIVRGIEPGGVEIIGSAEGAARRHVIPGVVVRNGEEVEHSIGIPGFADLGTVIRVLVSGTEERDVTVTVRPEDGSTGGESLSFAVDGGVVTELPIEELPDGGYAVEVSADVPLVAAVRFATTVTKPGSDGFRANDFAWATAAPALPAEALFVAPEAPTPELHVSNPSDAAITATLEAQGSAPATLAVPAGASITVPLAASTVYSLSGASGLHAAVTSVGDGLVSSFPVHAPAAASSPLRVYAQ